MISGIEPIRDGIISHLQTQLPLSLAAVEAQVLADGHPVQLKLPRVDNKAYFIEDQGEYEIYPNITVVSMDEISGDENSDYEWPTYKLSIWYLDIYEDKQILVRRVERAVRAIKDAVIKTLLNDAFANSVIRCGVDKVEYGPFLPGETDTSFLKGAKISLRAFTEESR